MTRGRLPFRAALAFRRQRRPAWQPWSVAGRLRIIIGVTVAAIALISIARITKAAEAHPAMTAATPPGWQLQRALPGEEFKPRGRFSDSRTSCLLDLASDATGSPKGTRLVCIRIERGER